MKKFAFICLALCFMSFGIGCCHHGYPYGGYQPYSPACPGGNCGIGYQGYAPAAALPVQGYSATTVAPAPVAAAPVYYQPFTTAAVNQFPTY